MNASAHSPDASPVPPREGVREPAPRRERTGWLSLLLIAVIAAVIAHHASLHAHVTEEIARATRAALVVDTALARLEADGAEASAADWAFAVAALEHAAASDWHFAGDAVHEATRRRVARLDAVRGDRQGLPDPAALVGN